MKEYLHGNTNSYIAQYRLSVAPGGVLYIFWVWGRAIEKGIDFHDFGIRNGIDFHDFGIRNGINFHNFRNWHRVGYAFSENWYKVRYIFFERLV